jgi:hypothetical protein
LIRAYNLKTRQLATLAIEGLEPPVVEPKKHNPLEVFAGLKPTKLAPAKLAAEGGEIRLRGSIELPFDWKVNDAAPLSYVVMSTSGDIVAAAGLGKLRQIEKPGTDFEIVLPAKADAGEATLHVGLQFYYCRDGAEGVCKEHTARLELPIRLDPNAATDKPTLLVKVVPKFEVKAP